MRKTTIIMAAALIAAAALTSCMSDNKAWLRQKELEVEATKTPATATLEGPGSIELQEGGKATIEVGR